MQNSFSFLHTGAFPRFAPSSLLVMLHTQALTIEATGVLSPWDALLDWLVACDQQF
jgi:hypothetical protein